MQTNRVPLALRDRLGPEAAAGLLQLFGDQRKEWLADVTAITGDRFERRLSEESSKLRVDMAQGFAGLRQEMAEGFSALRLEMAAGTNALRLEMAQQRFDILKWVFLFWVGQFFAIASLMAVLIRFLRTAP